MTTRGDFLGRIFSAYSYSIVALLFPLLLSKRHEMPDDDLEKYFTQSEKHMEIERVLGSFKLDPFAILELPYGEPDSNQVKKQYRKKSLMIHPDKVKHERAEEAFNLLKKAESELNDENRVRFLLGVIEEAKVETLREHGYKVKTQVVAKTDNNEEDKRPKTIIESNEEQYSFLKTDEGQKAMQSKVKALLIEMELRRRRQLKMEMEAEGN